jgi:hypothetical protein
MTLDEAMKEEGMAEVDFGNKTPVEPETPKEPITPVDPPAEPEGTKPDAGIKDKSDTPDKFDSKTYFKEKLGLEFENEDQFKEAWSSLNSSKTKLVDTEKKLSEVEALKTEYEKAFKPEGIFKTEKGKKGFQDLVIYDQLLEKMPDKDPNLLLDVISRDYSKAYVDSPVDVLVKDLMMNNPEIYSNADQAKDAVLKKYGITPGELDENDEPIPISDLDKKRMQVDAKETISKWNGYKSQVVMPKEVNLPEEVANKRASEETRKKTMTEATEPLFTKEIPSNLKEIKTEIILKGEEGEEPETINFDFEIGEGYAKSKAVTETLATVRNSYIQNGAEWTKEIEASVKEDVVQLLKANYLYKNLAQYSAALYEKAKTDEQDREFKRRGNPRPLRSDGTQKSPTKDQKKEQAFYKDAEDVLGFKIT